MIVDTRTDFTQAPRRKSAHQGQQISRTACPGTCSTNSPDELIA